VKWLAHLDAALDEFGARSFEVRRNQVYPLH
jgi:hypothetical protein